MPPSADRHANAGLGLGHSEYRSDGAPLTVRGKIPVDVVGGSNSSSRAKTLSISKKEKLWKKPVEQAYRPNSVFFAHFAPSFAFFAVKVFGF
jgi:hypothetical protein